MKYGVGPYHIQPCLDVDVDMVESKPGRVITSVPVHSYEVGHYWMPGCVVSVLNVSTIPNVNVSGYSIILYNTADRQLLVKCYDIKMVKLPGGSSCRSSSMQLTNKKK